MTNALICNEENPVFCSLIPTTDEERAEVYNMAVMGAYLKIKPIVSYDNIDRGLAKCIPARYSDLISLNRQAIDEGMKAVEEL